MSEPNEIPCQTCIDADDPECFDCGGSGTVEEENQTRKFKLHWRDGTVTETEGANVEDAFTHAGFGAGAVGALDFWEEVK